MINGVLTAVLLFAFLLIVAWAWSGRARPRFDEAARLPLHDEPPPATAPDCGCNREPRA